MKIIKHVKSLDRSPAKNIILDIQFFFLGPSTYTYYVEDKSLVLPLFVFTLFSFYKEVLKYGSAI